MSAGSSSEVKFDIGHVLFIDIVGYSKLLIAEQSDQIQTLREIVRGTEQFRKADAEGKLLRLPTGDGGALVFRNSLEAPVLCALEISKALKSHPEIKVRMGIHSGPVNEITDLNEQANIAGVGINMAQRVMDCGDAGHILLSKRVADDLEQYPQWRSRLSDLGECEVKHGTRVSVVNLYTDDAGNRAAPEKFSKQSATAPLSGSVPRRDSKFALIASAAFVLVIAGVGLWFLSRQKGSHSSSSTSSPSSAVAAIPEKSIAVLPFDNLSRDPDNAYFAEGVQDEILTRLAKVADLKVISRTSTQRFKSTPADLRDIAKQLGVMHIVEGSVQKANDQVRVNVQLINAMTDGHLWADTYDRKLTDLFAVESDIAKTIADTLQAKLTGSEKMAMSKAPTINPDAYQLYLQGRFFWNKRTAADLRKAAEYFDQAIQIDPNYALAYATKAQALFLLPAYGGGAPNDYFPAAKVAAEKAVTLDPLSSDAQAVLASLKAIYEWDYPGSIAAYERVIELNPNDATARQWFGNTILANAGKVEREEKELKRALELDPLSLVINTNTGIAYFHAGHFDQAIAQLRKTLEMDQNFYYARYNLGLVLEIKGDGASAVKELQKAVEISDDPIPLAFLGNLYGNLGQRDEAQRILNQLQQRREHRYTDAYALAVVCLGLGERDDALRWLEQGYQDHDGFNIGQIRIDPVLKPLHGDKRFEALAEKIIPARDFGSRMGESK
jgi:TolB-like protein/tetratricopeptide (TPR) repeat protein